MTTPVTTLGRKWPFSATLIEDAPETPGLYTLWADGTLLYVGRASGGTDTIRGRLTAYLRRAEAREVPAATHYGWEICRHPKEREAQVLAELQRFFPRHSAGSMAA